MNKIIWLFLAVILGQSLGYAGPLHYAARTGNLDEVKRLIDSGANIEEREFYYNWTPLNAAASSGKPEIVKELLKRGADIKAENYKDKTALETAAGMAILSATMNDHAMKMAYHEIINMIKQRSIESQVRLYPKEIEILEKNDPGSYNREFAAYGALLEQRAARRTAVGKATGIPKGPASIIHEYMGDDDDQ